MADEKLACFKAYDVRGQVPYDLNLELVRQIGLAFVAEFAPKTVCIGYDMRLTSLDFSRVLAQGLMDGGAHVIDLGLCGTEEVYFATASQGFDGGIMITASHNPADWNGMKLVRKDSVPVSADSGLLALENRILSKDLPLAQVEGTYRKQSFRQEYIQHLLSYFDMPVVDLAPLTIVANPGNGCAWLVLEELAKYLPCRIIPMQKEPDGTFPNGVPNPLLPENREATRQAVLKHKADLGLAWDGDFDRCFFFDEQGGFIEGYYLVGLLAQVVLAKYPGAAIVHDPRLYWNTEEIVAAAQGKCVESKAGHAFIKERMRIENAVYGGEMSAHHYFRDFSFCDSGMIVWLLIYQLMSKTKQPLSELVVDRMTRYPVSGEINRKIADPGAVIAQIEAKYAPGALEISYVDGLSITFKDWRFNVRQSNTEPLLRLNVESRNDASLVLEKTEELLAMMI